MERCRRGIAAIEAEILAGNPDPPGLCLALSAWSAELRILQDEERRRIKPNRSSKEGKLHVGNLDRSHMDSQKDLQTNTGDELRKARVDLRDALDKIILLKGENELLRMLRQSPTAWNRVDLRSAARSFGRSHRW
jgi:hypothetical protein